VTLEGAWLAPGTLGDVLRRSTEHLAATGSDTPRLDAELLLAHALGVARIDLYMQLDRPLDPSELDAARALVGRRAAREPLQYILGEWGFRRLTLTVDRRALIPRPETEVVVERCLGLLESVDAPAVIDVGTGTGAIALALADERPDASVTAIDISDDALSLAAENAERTGFADRVRLVRHDVADGLPGGPYHLVVANPPYVEPGDLDTLQPEVRDWEPRDALLGEGVTEAVARQATSVLHAGGALVLEVADGTASHIASMLEGLGYADVRATPDLAGRDRVVEGRWES
jgi:release factor glutamine methyltransferase